MGGSLFIAIIVVMIVVLLTNNNNLPPAKGAPQSIRIALPSNEPTVI